MENYSSRKEAEEATQKHYLEQRAEIARRDLALIDSSTERLWYRIKNGAALQLLVIVLAFIGFSVLLALGIAAGGEQLYPSYGFVFFWLTMTVAVSLALLSLVRELKKIPRELW